MQKIYICDDNEIHLLKVKEIIQEEILSNDYEMNIEKCYLSSEELIFDTVKSNKKSIYFLDVEVDGTKNGFKIASEIRELQPNCFIIFVTSHFELAYDVFNYRVEPLDYIVKEINTENVKKRISDCLITIHNRVCSKVKDGEKFSIKIGRANISEYLSNIISFEKVQGSDRVIMTTKEEKIEFYASIVNIAVNLNDDFCRCKRNYIINKRYIDFVDKNKKMIYMKDGSVFSYSSKMAKELL